MAKKELWQIGWAGGQTEGDLSKQTVKEILNSEINILGTLTPRNEIVHITGDDESITNTIDMKFMTNPADPDETLSVFLTTTHLRIRGATVTEDFSFGVTLDTDSEMIIVEGTLIYIAAIVSGDPIGVYSVSYINEGDRFKPPAHMQNHSDANEDTSGTSSWILEPVGGLVPVLTHIPMESTYTTDADTECASSPEKKVVIGTFLKEDMFSVDKTSLPLDRSLSVELGVQFVFQSGQVSPLSNTFTISISAAEVSWERNIALGINLAVSRDISRTVSKIHVYRKILELEGVKYSAGDQPYDLIYTAEMMSNDLENLDITASEGHILKYNEDADPRPGTENHIGYTLYGFNDGAPDADFVLRAIRARSVGVGTVITETKGWFEFETNTMFFWPRALTFSGALTMTLEDENVPTNNNYTAAYTSSQGVFLFESETGSLATMFTDTTAIEAFTYCPMVAIDCSGVDAMPLREADVTINHREWGADMAPFMTHMGVDGNASGEYANNPGSGTITKVQNQKCLLCHLDIGETGLADLEDILGYSQGEASTVYPRHIAYSSGRLLMLNLIQDDQNKPSRMAYSEFRKYRSVAKSNYVDYAPRDDGVGMAIAEFKGRVLVLHSTSAYIMDISGGSGMSWRELGAYNEINSLGRPAVVETPFGVFFGGVDYAYLFDGQKIVNISETPERRISDKYREMVGRGTPSFAWRSDLRQLWIVSLGDDGESDQRLEALVFDADRAAWHYHIFNELLSTTALPLEFLATSNQGGQEYLFCDENAATINKYGFDDTTVVRPFTWGIYTGQINMGSSEFQKKLKRIYIDTEGKVGDDGTETYGKISLDVDGYEQDFAPEVERHVTRISASNKNYYLDFSILAKADGGESWTGTIESLGLSYKPKKLK